MLAAYCFDRAVMLFGDSLRAELESVEGKSSEDVERKRKSVLRRWIPAIRAAQKFADPAMM